MTLLTFASLAILPIEASAQPLERKLAEFRDLAKERRLKNNVPSMSYAIVEDAALSLRKVWGGRTTTPKSGQPASSGIVASVRELALYSIALDEGRVLSPALREEMWTAPANADGEVSSYGYGWWVQNWRGQKLVWHGGWWPDAYAGFLLKVPDKHLTLVAFGNTDGLHWGNRLQVAEIEEGPLALKFLELFAVE